MAIFMYSCLKTETPTTTAQSETTETTQNRDLIFNVGDGCIPTTPVNVTCTQYPNVPMTINNHPMYPGCTFYLNVGYKICVDANGNATFYVGDFTIKSHDCNQYSFDLNNTPASAFENWVAFFNQNMYDLIALKLIGLSPLGAQVVNIDFIVSTCARYCIYYDSKFGGYNFARKRCSDACCQRSKTFTLNSSGNWVLTTTSITQTPIPIWQCVPGFESVCPSGTVWQFPPNNQCYMECR